MKVSLCCLLLAFSQALAHARLGETAVEINKRYGAVSDRKDTGTNSWHGTYHFKEYRIIVYYFNERSCTEALRPIDDRKMSDEECEGLIRAIGGEEGWKKQEGIVSMDTIWLNTKTQAVAQKKYSILPPDALVIMSAEQIARSKADKKRQDQEKSKGF